MKWDTDIARPPDGWVRNPDFRLPGSTASVGVWRKRVKDGHVQVFVAREPRNNGPEVWHLSISHPVRLPTWDEIKDARYALMPDGINMAIMFPPKAVYVNLHNYTFHLWEIPLDMAEL